MIWDRVTRGPATLNNRKLIRLSRKDAEATFAQLLSPEEQSTGVAQPAHQWQLLYGHEVVDCRDEHEAKILARTLIKKGLTVSARLSDGQTILWTIEGRDQTRAWLSK